MVYFFSGLQVSGTRNQIWNPSGSYFRYFFVFPLPNVLQVLLCLEGNFELSHCIRSQYFKMWNQSPYNECGLLVWIYSLLQKYDCFLVLLPLTRLLQWLDSNQGTNNYIFLSSWISGFLCYKLKIESIRNSFADKTTY